MQRDSVLSKVVWLCDSKYFVFAVDDVIATCLCGRYQPACDVADWQEYKGKSLCRKCLRLAMAAGVPHAPSKKRLRQQRAAPVADSAALPEEQAVAAAVGSEIRGGAHAFLSALASAAAGALGIGDQ